MLKCIFGIFLSLAMLLLVACSQGKPLTNDKLHHASSEVKAKNSVSNISLDQVENPFTYANRMELTIPKLSCQKLKKEI